MWKQNISEDLSYLSGKYLTKKKKNLNNNFTINKIINKKMPLSGTLLTLLFLLSSSFVALSLSSDISVKTAFASHESTTLNNPEYLQSRSDNLFASLEGISSIGFGSQGSAQGSDSRIYENPDYMVSMMYPSDWRESRHPESPPALLIQLKPQGRQDVYLAVWVFATEPGTTQEDLNDANLQFLREQGNEILHSGTFSMGGVNDAFFIEYEDPEEGIIRTQVSALKNDNEYMVEYGGTPQAYNSYLPVGEQIVSSVEIGDYGDVREFGQDQGLNQGGSGNQFGQQGSDGTSGSSGGFGQDQGLNQGGSGNQFGQQGSDGTSGSSGSMSQTGNLLEYSNPDLGFRIAYPDGATIEEDQNGVMFTTDLGVAGVSVATDVGLELDRYTDFRIDKLREGATGFHVVTSEESTLSGYPAHLLVYSEQRENTMLRALALWTLSDNTAYNVVFVAPVSTVESFIPIVVNMIDSFEITNTGAGSDNGQEDRESEELGSGVRS
jgi:hypothetical protein